MDKPEIRMELVDKLVEAAPEEMEAAARDMADFDCWIEAGAPLRDAEEVFAEFLERIDEQGRAIMCGPRVHGLPR